MSAPYQSIYTGAEVDQAIGIALGFELTSPDPTYRGSWDIGDTAESGSVTGLGLPFVPTKVILTVEIPLGGFVMFACPIRGTLSADGFDFQLNGVTDSTNYRLHYTLIGDVLTDSSS